MGASGIARMKRLSVDKGGSAFTYTTVVPVLLVAALFAAVIFGLLLPEFERGLIEKKKQKIQDLVRTTVSMLGEYQRRVRDGELSDTEARARALARVGHLRYGPDGKDYFWINDTAAVLLVHPYRRELEGTDLTEYRDPRGTVLFIDAIKRAVAGGGFIEYMWQRKDDPDRIIPKVSYVELFEPWGWVIGTGVYTDDVAAEIGAITGRLALISLSILLAACLLLARIVRKAAENDRKRRQAEERIGHLNLVLLAIRNVNQLIVRERDGAVIIRDACRLLTETRGYERAAILLVDDSSGYAGASYSGFGAGGAAFDGKLRSGDLCACWREALEGGETVIIGGARDVCESCPFVAGFPVSSFCLRRLRHGDRTFGLLAVWMPAGFVLDDDEKNLIGEVAGDLAFALYNIDLEKSGAASRRHAEALTGLLNFAIDQTPVPIIIAEAPDVSIRFLNAAARELLAKPGVLPDGSDYSRHTTFWSIFRVDKTPYAPEELPLSRAVLRGETVIDEEVIIRRGGADRNVLASAAPLRDERGEIVAGIVVFPDITEIRRAEKTLAESEERLKLALDGALEGLWDWNIVTGEVFFSRRWAAMLGYDSSELAPHVETWENLLHPDDRVTVLAALNAHLEGRLDVYESEHRLKAKNGEWRWILDRGKVMERDAAGRPLRAVGTHLDVTEKKKIIAEKFELEEQLRQSEKLRAIGQLAGGIAHDFNNLLGGIIGSAELLQIKTVLPEEQKIYLTSIIDTAMRAAELTDQLTTFARKGKYLSIDVDVHEVVDRVVGLLRHSTEGRICIKTDFGAGSSVTRGDPTHLQNLFLNLGVNARDAMPDGGELTFTSSNFSPDAKFIEQNPELAPGEYIRIDVRDTGTGIPPEIIGRIFEPFFTTKPEGKGTGLGLAGVFGCVKSHHGHIGVESVPGEGTTFHVYLPLLAALPEAGDGPVPGIVHGNGRIMVVDDEDVIREVICNALSLMGYEAQEFADGPAAVEYFRANRDRVDLIVLDMAMPGMDGPTTFRRLKEIDPNVRVLLATGFAENEALDGIMAEGVLGFVRKPLRAGTLSAKLAEILRKRILPEG